MKLRFLHLPAFGPLRDISVVFHQNTLLPRAGALNFVVGVNGTGKSSLLRALYMVLRGLNNAVESLEPLPFAFALAYDANYRQPARTVLFWHPGGTMPRARMVLFDTILPSDADWAALMAGLAADKTPPSAHIVPGDRFMGSGDLREHLPRHVLAYTSGDFEPWEQAVERFIDTEILETLGSKKGPERPADDDDYVGLPRLETLDSKEGPERPRRWTPARELALPEASETDWQEVARRERIQPQLPSALPRCPLLRPEETKFAALALALWHTAEELKSLVTDADLQRLRQTLIEDRSAPTRSGGARRLLQEVDWFRATHLSLTLRREAFAQDDLKAMLWSLYALSDEVVEQPLGRQQVVISLGRRPAAGSVRDVAGEFFSDRVPPVVATCVERVESAATGAEAVLRLFSPEGRLWELFERLLLWQRAGLIEDVTLTIQRLAQVQRADDARDDVVLTYDSLSDGEQMLLGRMALLFLLQGMHGSLLLLDEPETHFNDVWKREIVDLVDDNVLKGTRAQVVVATHTSIALTDVFNEEVTLLQRGAESAQIFAVPLEARSFGASLVEIMRGVFGATDSVGQRAREFMEMVLAVVGQPNKVMRLWRQLDSAGFDQSLDFLHLVELVRLARKLPPDSEAELKPLVLRFVRQLHDLAVRHGETPGAPRLVDAVAVIEQQLGAGYYQFELRRRMRALSDFQPEPERPIESGEDVVRRLGLRRKPRGESSGGATAKGE